MNRFIAPFAVILSLCLIFATVPLTIDTDSGMLTAKQALAGKGGNGSGNGGGNGGGKGRGGKAQSEGNTRKANTDIHRLIVPLEPEILMVQFTTRIAKRYPADELTVLTNPHQPVSFYCEVSGMKGQEIFHRWYYEEELKFEANFTIRGERWRVWSTQLLPEDMPGEWTVEVVGSDGNILATQKMVFMPQGSEIAAN